MGQLFSKYFLEEGIKETFDYKNLDNETLYKKYKKIKNVYSIFPKNLNKDETFTEDNLIKPILNELGFFYTRQPSLEKKGRRDVPDYILFTDEEDKEIFDRSEKSELPFHRASLILEAKRWNRALDKGDKLDPIDPSIPSNQILRYLSIIESSSNGKVLWGILTNGRCWRLYYHKFPSRSEGFIEFDLDEILEGKATLFEEENLEKFKIFYLLLRKEAFIKIPERPDKTFLEIALEEGKKWEERISSDLKDKIFTDVFPRLAKGFIANIKQEIDGNILKEIYDNVLIFLYRLLFLFYAEDRSLLPNYDKNYYEYSITKIREEIKEKIDKNETLSEKATSYYNRLNDLFEIINSGDRSLKIPPYNGKLFDNNYYPFLEENSIPDKFLIPAIDKLSRNYKDENKIWINYRELSVRQLGTIYEGLLEFKLKIAEDNLKIKKEKGLEIYEVAKEGEKIDIKKGELYITNDKSERKATGSYYTPDYIVQYIVKSCLEPLIEQKVKEFEKQIERIKNLDRNEVVKELFRLNKNNKIDFLKNEILKKYDIIDSILKIKIVDPAMGSGHFLVGAVDYLSDRILELIDQYNNKEIFGNEKYVIPIVEKIEDIRKRIVEKSEKEGYIIQLNYLNDKDIIKRIVLKRCIYGVDLNPLAVELAKVSLWLHTFMIGAPLSFLDHHLKCGNSLIGSELEDFYQKVLNKELWLFGSPFTGFLRAIDELKKLETIDDIDISEIEESNKIYEDVIRIVKPYKKLLNLYTASFFVEDNSPIEFIDGRKGEPLDIILGKISLNSEEKEVLENSLKISKEKRFFHWKLEFPEVFYEENKTKENLGFDVVIGNPPYIRQEKLKDIKDNFRKLDYEVYDASADIYTYFYEKGFDILRVGGILGFITSNKWMRAKYGEKLRNLFLNKTNIKQIIDFGGVKVFETSTVDTNITIFEKRAKDLENEILVSNVKDDFEGDLYNYLNKNKFYLKQNDLNVNTFTIENKDVLELKRKIERIGIPLKDWNVKIYFGIKTGFNEAFIIDSKKREEILNNCKDEDERKRTEDIIKPVLRGRDIGRYYYKWAGLWIIKIESGWTNTNRGTTNPEEFFKQKYPAIYNHLISFTKNKGKGKGLFNRDDQGDYWWELRECSYYPEFEKEKIVWQEISDEPSFAYDVNKFYTNQTAYIATGEPLKYIIACLNSKLAFLYLKLIAYSLSENANRWIKQYVERIPIPPITPQNQQKARELETLVDKMINLTYKKQILELFIEDEIKSGTKEMLEVLKQLQTHPSWIDNSSLEYKKEIAKNLITSYEDQIKETDKLINSIVYTLYNLTTDEIRLIES